jgi:uncharacterized protein (UPF0332 family)
VEEPADLTDPQLWLSLADHKLRMARKHVDDGEYRDSGSDSYYAMFHVARAALAVSGIESRRHSGIASLFSEIFVKTGKVERELSRTLMRSLQLRDDADYAPRTTTNREKAEQALAEAEAFVGQVRTLAGQDAA